MNVLLTTCYEPAEPRTPIAVLDLAAYWRAAGHAVTICYADALPDVLGWFDMIGLSALQFDQCTWDALESIRSRYTGRVVLGGKSTDTLSAAAVERLQASGIEIHHGHGEQLLSDAPTNWGNYPAWSEEDFRAMDPQGQMTEAMSSRGCPYRCHFCFNSEPRIREFSPERTANHLELILKRLGRWRVFLVDDVFATRADRIRDVLAACDRIGLDVRGKLHFFVHVRCLNPSVLDAICEIKPGEVQIGIESGSDRMLAAMNKGFNAATAEERIRELHRRGIRAAALMLLGYPGETKESLAESVDWVNRNRKFLSGWWASLYQPVRGTVGWQEAAKDAGREIDGHRNVELTYVASGVTAEDLSGAKSAIMGGD